MQRRQTFKYELQPSGEQERNMRKFAGSCRFVFNKALALQKENHEAGNKFISYVSMAKQLTQWRSTAETPWLKESPCHPQQHALKEPTKTFSLNVPIFPVLKRKLAVPIFVIQMPHNSSSSKKITVSSCRNSAGFVTAKVVVL